MEAARSVSRLYLDELAGRREQVVKNNISNNIRVIDVALGLLNEADLQDPEHLSNYQRRLKLLFELERFAFVDEDGFVYTADDRISAVSSGIILRSVILSAVTALVLGMMFAYLIMQLRKNAALALEKETAEVESRIKHEEMEHRLELQEEILRQKADREQQEKMIVALASDYRSVYYLELDKNHGICFQSRSDLDGFKAGEAGMQAHIAKPVDVNVLVKELNRVLRSASGQSPSAQTSRD